MTGISVPVSLMTGKSDRYFCTEHSFAGHSGLYCGDSLAVSIPVCV